MIENVLTIDLEEWFHANYQKDLFNNTDIYEERVVQNTTRLLELFEEHNAKATFFTLGYVAEKYPKLLELINNKGHEIATHGYGHELVYSQTEDEFENDLYKSIKVIEEATGQKPKGYRAPSWSVTKNTKWVFKILKKHGIQYDASIFPVKTFLYGIPDAPRFPFCIDINEGQVQEFPTSTIRFLNKNIPFSGGFYFRLYPFFITKKIFQNLNYQGKPVIFYLHPREIDPDQPILKNLNFRDHFIHYYGVKSCETKLVKLLKSFKFITVSSYFEKNPLLKSEFI